MAMRPYNLTQYNPMLVDQARSRNRLNQMRVQQAEGELDRRNRLMEILGGRDSDQPDVGSTNRLRNAALEAGGGPTKRAASMMDQAGGGMQAARTQPGGSQLSQREMMEVMALDPQLGARIQSIRESQSEQQRAAEDREAAVIAFGADRIEQLPEGQRDQAWQAYKRRAGRHYDVSDWPDEYDPNAITLARARASQAGGYEMPEAPGVEQFTINRGGQEVTVVGDPARPDTWQEVATAPRWQPDGKSNVTSFDTYQNATNEPLTIGGQTVEPGGTITLDERDPQDAALIRENRTALRPAPSRQEQGQPGEFMPSDPGRRVANLLGMQGDSRTLKDQGIAIPKASRIRELEQQKGSSVSLIRNTRRIAALIRGRPELTGLSGDIIRSLNALRAEAEGFAQAAGVELDAPTNVEAYSDTFREIGVENNRLQSAIIDAAYTLATSRENGRLSESDVRNAIRSLGSSSDPQAFAATLNDVARRVDERFRDQAEASLGKRPDTLMREMEEDVFGAPIANMDGGQLRQMIEAGQVTPQDLQLLSPEQLQEVREKVRSATESDGGPPPRSAR